MRNSYYLDKVIGLHNFILMPILTVLPVTKRLRSSHERNLKYFIKLLSILALIIWVFIVLIPSFIYYIYLGSMFILSHER